MPHNGSVTWYFGSAVNCIRPYFLFCSFWCCLTESAGGTAAGDLKMPELEMNGEAESSDTSSCETDGSVGLRQPQPTDLGKRVLFYSSQDKKEKYGVLRYIGKPEFADGTWCGVELDGPHGKNNGSLQGIRYFSCETNYGVFVPASKVELDTRRKRPPSTEIKRKNSSGNLFIPSGISKLGSAPSVQQEMVQRLTQPAMGDRFTKRKNPQASVTSRKLPLKAFAPKGMSKDDVLPRQSKKTPAVPSFRTGGMYRTQSTENIRKLKDKGEAVQGKPKKSSSEKDLRSSSKLNAHTNILVKPRRKPTRPTSAADLTDVSKTSTLSSSEGSAANTRHSSVEPWPKSSTPSARRDDSTPDGCSSSDEGGESFSNHDTSTGTSQEMSAQPSVLDSAAMAANLASIEKAFVATPESSNKGKVAVPTGLATQAKELAESERSAPTQDPCRVPSPELCPKTRYNNRPSGTATLQHPLTQTSNAPEATNGYICDSTLDLSQSEGVSVAQVVRQQYGYWHSSQVALEGRIQELELELRDARALHRSELETVNSRLKDVQASHEAKLRQLQTQYRAEIRRLTSSHQQELISLHKAHTHALEEQRRNFERQRAV